MFKLLKYIKCKKEQNNNNNRNKNGEIEKNLSNLMRSYITFTQ